MKVISKTANMKLQIMQAHDIFMATGAKVSDDAGNTLVRDNDNMGKIQLTVSYAGITLEPSTFCGDSCLVGKVRYAAQPPPARKELTVFRSFTVLSCLLSCCLAFSLAEGHVQRQRNLHVPT